MKATSSRTKKSYHSFVSLAALILLQAATGLASAQQDPSNGAAQNPTPRSDSSSSSNAAAATPAQPATGKKGAAPSGRASTQLSPVVVKGEDITAQDAAKHDLAQTPGSAYYTDSAADLKRKSLNLTAADLLQFTPGVYAQSEGGNQGFRLSIRGSSLANTNTYKFGVGFYFDGLFFPGIAQQGAPVFIFEPEAVDHTEVLVGSNAFDFQTLDLGGAINFVDHTGYDSSPFQARFDAGSFGYYKGQVSSGLVEGPYDYYISVTDSSDQGFQDHTRESGRRVVGNFGVQITPDITNRFYFRYGNEYFQNGGLLTNAQIAARPGQANTAQSSQNAYYKVPSNFWFGDKLTAHLDADSQLEAGLSYDYSYMYSNSTGVAAAYAAAYAEQNLSPSLSYKRSDTLFGRADNSEIAFRSDWVFNSRSETFDYSVPTSATYGQLIREQDQGGTGQAVISASNELEVVPKLWLKTGISGIYYRDVDVVEKDIVPVSTINNGNDIQDRFDYAGVIGLRYDLNDDSQVFANVSRSVEPPTGSSLTNSATNASEYNLKAQTATTEEVGIRGKYKIFDGSLSLYRSEVNNELLTVATQLTPTVISSTSNASPTTHQGIELGLNTTLWQASDSTGDRPNNLILRQAYTYSDFYFNNDPAFGHAHLPAVPENFYQAELTYQHPTGFYIGVNTQYSSKIWEDFADTISSSPYATLGLKVGYAPPKQPWEVHLQVSNLTDQHYAAYIRQVADAKGVDSAVAAPADGLGVFAGASYHF